MLDSHTWLVAILLHRTRPSGHSVPWISGKSGQGTKGEVLYKSHMDGRVRKPQGNGTNNNNLEHFLR